MRQIVLVHEVPLASIEQDIVGLNVHPVIPSQSVLLHPLALSLADAGSAAKERTALSTATVPPSSTSRLKLFVIAGASFVDVEKGHDLSSGRARTDNGGHRSTMR
jgi:hypothetical protein